MEETPRPARRPRYKGKNPRQWHEKYKEHRGDEETISHVQSRGKTPVGRHIPILVEEILKCLALRPGRVGVDCTLGWGGHAEAMLGKIAPSGRLVGLDQDPLQLPLTAARLEAAGFTAPHFQPVRANFAGLAKALASVGLTEVDFLLADLGLSSMQIDNPERGFTFKQDGPLDMRMNPNRGLSARQLLVKTAFPKLAGILAENADEPAAEMLAERLAGKDFASTFALRRGIEAGVSTEEAEETVRRVFQALRIAVNEEFTALDTLLREIPARLKSGGRAAFLTFHSGEDRRVKKAIQAGLADGTYAETNRLVIRASAEELHRNPRAASAKLRWVEKG